MMENEQERQAKNFGMAYDRNMKAQEIHAKQIEAFSLAAMRAPALASAGGIAAMLGFLSANYARLEPVAGKLETVNAILFWFFVSAMLSVVAPGAAYFSQLCYQASLGDQDYDLESTLTLETKKSKRIATVGTCFRWLTVLLTVSSICSLFYGGWLFMTLV